MRYSLCRAIDRYAASSDRKTHDKILFAPRNRLRGHVFIRQGKFLLNIVLARRPVRRASAPTPEINRVMSAQGQKAVGDRRRKKSLC